MKSHYYYGQTSILKVRIDETKAVMTILEDASGMGVPGIEWLDSNIANIAVIYLSVSDFCSFIFMIFKW